MMRCKILKGHCLYPGCPQKLCIKIKKIKTNSTEKSRLSPKNGTNPYKITGPM